MQWIKRIEIHHFRSINELVVEELTDINVFSGLNDVGKSNVIKALNLFFNKQVDWQSPLRFHVDTNSWHSHYSKHGHSKKYISITVTFRNPGNYATLPNEFWVKREWDKDNPLEPMQTWGDVAGKKPKKDTTKGLTRFLNGCRFFYVPAIRDADYLRYLLGRFSEAIMEDEDDPQLVAASNDLANVITSRSQDLRAILKNVTGLEFNFELPKSMLSLLEAAGLTTEGDIPLQLRGDGIQGLTVPGILDYLSSRPKRAFYFWGFEEPENSLEYIRASHLAKQFQKYSKHAQIFISSHSPAFLSMNGMNTTIYRVSKTEEIYRQTGHKEKVTTLKAVIKNGVEQVGNLLPEELGLFEVMRQIDSNYREYQTRKVELEDLVARYHELTVPFLVVEGDHDVQTLSYIWKKFYGDEMPFKIVKAGDAKKVTELIVSFMHRTSRKICALYDNDGEGEKSIKYLNREPGFSLDPSAIRFRRYKLRDQILALTLPPPQGREDQATNLNMPLEFYFSDQVLETINQQPGNEIFSATNWIQRGESKDMDSESLAKLFELGLKTMAHRQIIEPGKSRLVDELGSLRDQDFEAFHGLFEMIVGHLVPEYELQRKI